MAGVRELDEVDVAASGRERASVGDRSDGVASSRVAFDWGRASTSWSRR
jgi:hypothetical protein